MLNTINIFLESIKLVSNRRMDFVCALLLPAIIYSALAGMSRLSDKVFYSFGIDMLALFFYVLVIVIVHRIVLLGAKSVTAWSIFHWTKRESWVFVYVLALDLFIHGYNLAPEYMLIPGLVVMGYLVPRCSLVFPGIAVDHSRSVVRSWRLTRDFQWDMILITVIYPFILMLVFAVLIHLLNIEALLEGLVTGFVFRLLFTIITIYTIVMLSLAYEKITNQSSDI